jgi:hypothetical protein
MGSRADLRSAAGNDGYVLWNQERVLGETPILDESGRLRREKSRDRAVSLYYSQRSRAHADLPGVCRRPAG